MATIGPEERERERAARREEEGYAIERERSIKVVAGGSILEAVAGIGTIVLAIVGLTGALPWYLASIATIAFGVALLAQGGAIASRFTRLLHDAAPHDWDTRVDLGSGMGAEMFAGVAGIVLGILGVLGVATSVVIPIAVIVFGAALLLGSAATLDLTSISGPGAYDRAAYAARQASFAASGTQVLVGVGAIVLGILALVGLERDTLSLVALLVLGGSVLLSGSAIGGRMISLLRR